MLLISSSPLSPPSLSLSKNRRHLGMEIYFTLLFSIRSPIFPVPPSSYLSRSVFFPGDHLASTSFRDSLVSSGSVLFTRSAVQSRAISRARSKTNTSALQNIRVIRARRLKARTEAQNESVIVISLRSSIVFTVWHKSAIPPACCEHALSNSIRVGMHCINTLTPRPQHAGTGRLHQARILARCPRRRCLLQLPSTATSLLAPAETLPPSVPSTPRHAMLASRLREFGTRLARSPPPIPSSLASFKTAVQFPGLRRMAPATVLCPSLR